MSSPSTWHRISEINSEAKTGLCSQCGPGARLYLRPKAGQWVCHAKRYGDKRQPHGLTQEEARTFLRGEHCRICGTIENLVVDHCHDSMRVRGPLCRNHNTALGLFDDNVDHLRNAIGYLLGVDNLLEPL